jgi:RES domain-containing protein
MRLWRVSAHAAFDGEGARRFGGRWNRPGVAVIYAAATLALATLEYIVHVNRTRAPARLVAHYADVPDDVNIERLGDDALPSGWRNYPAPDPVRDIGTGWATAAGSLLLAVPSAVLRVPPALAPAERNYLVNPAHADFRRIRARSVTLALDPRLWS